MIKLDELKVTQNQPRNIEKVFSLADDMMCHLVDHSPPMQLDNKVVVKVFEDGEYYLHDGHHRALARCLSGSDVLLDGDYIIKEYTYDSFLEINFDVGWVTPFDIRNEVRVPDLSNFKYKVFRLYDTLGRTAASKWITRNKHLYTEPRKVRTVKDMCRYNDIKKEYCKYRLV